MNPREQRLSEATERLPAGDPIPVVNQRPLWFQFLFCDINDSGRGEPSQIVFLNPPRLGARLGEETFTSITTAARSGLSSAHESDFKCLTFQSSLIFMFVSGFFVITNIT